MNVEVAKSTPGRVPQPTGAPRESARPPRLTLLKWFQRFVLRMCVLFVMYALSIGPLYWQWYGSRFAGGSILLAAFYEPLFLLGALVPSFGSWMDWYVNLWIV